MALKSIRQWLGFGDADTGTPEPAPLRETLEALDHLEPDRAKYLASFAYLLGRVAHADQNVSAAETRAMEALVREHGELSDEQAMVVVQLAKTSNLLFGGTANVTVAKEFAALASYEQKLALVRCLFAVSITDDAVSLAEEGEIHRIAAELRVLHEDLVALRVAHLRHLPGLSSRPDQR
ncbi:MAG: TerB family tellurite resistance protein [Vicinamibacterales bacterium]